MTRKSHRWKVQLQAHETGEVIDYPLEAYWDPEHETTREGVAAAAKAEAWWKSGQKLHFAPIKVELAGA